MVELSVHINTRATINLLLIEGRRIVRGAPSFLGPGEWLELRHSVAGETHDLQEEKLNQLEEKIRQIKIGGLNLA